MGNNSASDLQGVRDQWSKPHDEALSVGVKETGAAGVGEKLLQFYITLLRTKGATGDGAEKEHGAIWVPLRVYDVEVDQKFYEM